MIFHNCEEIAAAGLQFLDAAPLTHRVTSRVTMRFLEGNDRPKKSRVLEYLNMATANCLHKQVTEGDDFQKGLVEIAVKRHGIQMILHSYPQYVRSRGDGDGSKACEPVGHVSLLSRLENSRA